MGLPAEADGGGASHLDLVLAAQQYGRHLAPVPFAECVAAGGILAAAGASDLLSGVSDGSILPTVALSPAHDGRLRLVPAGAVAEVVVELATGPSAVQLYHDGVSQWKLLMAAALGGLRSAALELGVSHVKARKAFGVTIGSFQAIQHRLADLTVAGDGAELLVYEAAWAWDTGQPEAAALTSMAFLFGADYAFRTTRECLQFHGGYGFTLEYDIQLYFRRAKAWPLALGDSRREYQRLADIVYPDASGQKAGK
jgi:alkylation response protein AidB-like acyl-CoA dehydrogenase